MSCKPRRSLVASPSVRAFLLSSTCLSTMRAPKLPLAPKLPSSFFPGFPSHSSPLTTRCMSKILLSSSSRAYIRNFTVGKLREAHKAYRKTLHLLRLLAFVVLLRKRHCKAHFCGKLGVQRIVFVSTCSIPEGHHRRSFPPPHHHHLPRVTRPSQPLPDPHFAPAGSRAFA